MAVIKDTLPGGHKLIGTPDADLIYGLDGDDTVYGLAGNDTLEGGLGNDILDGGDGFDYASYQFATGSVNVNLSTGSSSGADGNDTLISIEGINGSNFDDTLIGDDGGNVLLGSAGNDFLDGRGGNDILAGGLGNDFLDGGDGIDFASYRFAAEDKSPGSKLGVNVDLATGRSSGTDGIDTLTGIEGITGSSFNDTLIGDAGGNQLEGLVGDDLLIGGAGFDSAIYSGASGAVFVNLTTERASGADGIDTLIGIEGIIGSSFNDILTGNISNNAIVGAAGSDNIVGGAGDDTLAGDDFNEKAISGPPGNDSISGGTGNDFLTGEGGNDTLNGDDGNDILIGGAGNDTLNGGTGFDSAGYDLAPAAVNVDLTTGRASGGDGSDRLSSIEALSGSIFNDTLIGNTSDNNLFGQPGNDTLDGRGGNDQLFGGAGNDTLNGGDGFDYASYQFAPSAVNVSLTTGRASGGEGNDTLIGIEGITGSDFNDTLTGDAGGNNLLGLAGNDTLDSRDGNDQLFGSQGNDTLNGGTGFDSADYSNLGQAITLLPQGQISKGSLGTDLILNIERIVGAIGQANAIDGGSGTGGTSFTINLSANSLIVNNIPGIGTATFVVENFVNVTGTPNSDSITGNSSNNILVGGAGKDFLNGGNGNDTLVGGLNADQFGFNFTFFQPPLGIDFIKDFNFLEEDKIQIISSGGTPTLDRFIFDPSTGALFFDKTQFVTLQPGSGFDVGRDIVITPA